MPTHFRWVTEWVFEAAPGSVWRLLVDAEGYPAWWPGIRHVRILNGEGGPGTVAEHRVHAGPGLALKFLVTVERRTEQSLIISRVEGDSEGRTEWRVAPAANGGTIVTHVWDVELKRSLLRLTARLPGAAKFFEARHRKTMAGGRRNLHTLLAGTHSDS